MWKKSANAGRVERFDDILPPEVCTRILREYLQKPAVDRTNQAWGNHLVQWSNVVLVNDVSGDLKDKVMTAIYDRISAAASYTGNVMVNRWSKFSYLPKHTDTHVDAAVTIYLNEKYSVDEGGFYLYRMEGEENWAAIEPQFNRAVFSTGPVEHWVTPVTSNRDRITLQIFLQKKD